MKKFELTPPIAKRTLCLINEWTKTPPIMIPRISRHAGVILRVLAASLMLSLSLAACTTVADHENERATSTQERIKRQQSQRWNQTTATGTATGAGVGALIGGVVAGRSGALVGAGVGALVGLAAGALVADRNLTFENREATASDRIASAREIASSLNEAANTAEQLGKKNRRKIIKLGQLYESGQITAGQYRAETANMRLDQELIRKRADEARDAKQRLQGSSSDLAQLTAEERTIDQAQRRLEKAAEDLEAALNRVPTG